MLFLSMSDSHDDNTDEILGITRCAQCGHRLEGEIECPFCAAIKGLDGISAKPARHWVPMWVLLTAMLLTFPLSTPWIIGSARLDRAQKIFMLIVGTGWAAGIVMRIW